MRRSSAPCQWRPRILPRGTILVTTRFGLSTALSDLGRSSDEEKEDVEYQHPEFPPQPVKAPVRMADQVEDDPELATLNAHADGDPPQAIVVTPGQTVRDVKPHVIAILPTYCGKRHEGPYEFLNESCKICKAQRLPAGASE